MWNTLENRKQAVAETLKIIQERCHPLLIGYGGSIAYGLDTPESDIDIRGIFLNPPEEWIGLQPEAEQLRPEDSDTVLYGLRKGMKLLLNGNPNVIELLGLHPEHILYCSDEGKMILDNASVFLSQKAASTFGAFAVNLRRQIQKQVNEGKTDAKTLSKEMTHLIRVYAMGSELLEDGRITVYRTYEHDLLMDIRAGKYLDTHQVPTADYERLLENYKDAFNTAMTRTCLPAEPDWEKANAMTMEIVKAYL
jgi:predicted nucleotidyltransferase